MTDKSSGGEPVPFGDQQALFYAELLQAPTFELNICAGVMLRHEAIKLVKMAGQCIRGSVDLLQLERQRNEELRAQLAAAEKERDEWILKHRDISLRCAKETIAKREAESRLAAAEADAGRVCVWTEDSDGIWNTGCGRVWAFTDGSIEDHDYHFCHGCGHKVSPMKYVDEDLQEDAALRSAEGGK